MNGIINATTMRKSESRLNVSRCFSHTEARVTVKSKNLQIVIFAWVCPCSIGWFWPIFLFSLRDINLTLGLLPLRRHVVWYDSVGVESSRLGLKSECADIFHQSFLCCYAILTSPKEGETAVYGYNPALFWVLPVSCWCLAELIFT